MAERIYGLKDLGPFTGNKSKTTIYAWIKLGLFPKPISTGPNSSGWLESELEAWQRKRIADSRQVAA
jgi:prophage regulatory protein